MEYNILVVDDDVVILEQLSALLKDIAEIYLATDGQSAIALARDIQPDLVLLDLGLPDIDGYDVMRAMKSTPRLKHIPIVVITSRAHSQSQFESYEQGAIAFLNKPIDGVIRKQVLNLLESHTTAKSHDDDMEDISYRFKNLFNMLSEAVVISDPNGRIEEVNQFCLNLFGYTRNELIGQNVKILTPPEIRRQHDKFIDDYNKTGEAHLIGNPREVEAYTKSGTPLVIELNLSEYKDNHSRHYIAVIRDNTEKRQTQAQLLKSAMYDPLTGLNSIVAFNLDMAKLSSTEAVNGYIYSVLLDIDDFQSLNAVLGTARCDELLQSIAEILNTIADKFSVRAYRLMSDRFILYGLENEDTTGQENKDRLISALEKALDELVSCINYSFGITGVCLKSSLRSVQKLDIKHQLELILVAERKVGHKGRINRANPESYEKGLQLASLKLNLHNDLDTSSLSIALQPKVDMNAQINSFEALLRWENQNFPLLYLGDYIDSAEDTGAIIQVGYFVLEETCQFLSSLPLGDRKRVFINLSIRQLSAHDFLANTLDICARYDIAPYEIGFEITESTISADLAFISQKLFEIRDAGFSLAIDDFGTGQSNLRYLNRLPISQLKIDKSFIDDIKDEKERHPLIDGIYYLAHSMSLEVVAEGVETAAQVAYVSRLGVDEIQGFYFYKPMPPSRCMAILADQ